VCVCVSGSFNPFAAHHVLLPPSPSHSPYATPPAPWDVPQVSLPPTHMTVYVLAIIHSVCHGQRGMGKPSRMTPAYDGRYTVAGCARNKAPCTPGPPALPGLVCPPRIPLVWCSSAPIGMPLAPGPITECATSRAIGCSCSRVPSPCHHKRYRHRRMPRGRSRFMDIFFGTFYEVWAEYFFPTPMPKPPLGPQTPPPSTEMQVVERGFSRIDLFLGCSSRLEVHASSHSIQTAWALSFSHEVHFINVQPSR